MLKGKGISEGIGIGKAFVLEKEEIKIEKSKIYPPILVMVIKLFRIHPSKSIFWQAE